MFIGEFQHTIDEKGRFIMPSKLRDDLGEIFYITKGLDGCLFVFPQGEWQQLTGKIASMDLTHREARAFSRIFFAGAQETGLDRQGRILINPTLREFAELFKDIVIIGVSTRVEIWSKKRWDEYNGMDSADLDLLAGHLKELGL